MKESSVNELDALNWRVATLERRLRLAVRAGVTLPLIAAAALMLGQAPASNQPAKRVIEAEEFLVRDKDGRPRIRIGPDPTIPSIKILDSEGKPIVLLQGSSALVHSAMVQVQAKNGMTATLSAGSDDVHLSLRTGMEKEEVEDLLRRGKEAFLAHAEKPDPKRSWLSLSLDERRAQVSIWKGGQPRGSWSVEDDTTQLYLADRNGAVRGMWEIRDEMPSLYLLDSQMKSRLVLGASQLKDMSAGSVTRRTESSILLFGEDGKVIYSAP